MTTTRGRTVYVHYYAVLREQSGRADENVFTESETAFDLFLELKERYHFSLPPDRLKVVLNAEFGEWDSKINEGDTVIFLPPVAGG